jgi:hypothetical protein
MNYAKEEPTTVVLPQDAPYITIERLARIESDVVYKYVKVLGKKERRKMKKILVCLHNQMFNAFADCVTGSIYNAATGLCLSSTNLYIVRK